MIRSLQITFTTLLATVLLLVAQTSAHAAERVILISVDGLRPDAITTLGPDAVPNFYRLREEGVFTDNARTDFDFTVTLPNHTCMVTGRRVAGPEGHGWDKNGNSEVTMHEFKGEYVASMFDVAHDAGLSTALFASKTKFSLYDNSYSETNGAEHPNGRDKLDYYFQAISGGGEKITAEPVVDKLIEELSNQTYQLTMLHILDPDATGHHSEWMTEAYLNSVKRSDVMLGRVLAFIESHPDYAGKTTIILTADHGGTEGSHGSNEDPNNYTVPFYIWGSDVVEPADLYEVNKDSRKDPGQDRPDYTGPQPIRNGDAGNLALSLLGLPPIPGSMLNADQSLLVSPPTRGDSR